MYKYVLHYPAGNTTALVFGYNDLDFKQINDEILAKHKDVEQVGFIFMNKLRMAGGEICFNALRCAAKFILDFDDTKETIIEMNDKEYQCGINDNSFIKESELKQKYENKKFYYMRISDNYEINKISDYEYFVDLGDIFHVVYTKELDLNKIDLKEHAYSYFKEHNLLDKKACGFMYLHNNCLEPIVWVRDIKTLFYESACGSGSFSSFLYINKILNKDYLALKQPSNEYLFLRKVDDLIEISSIIEDIT